MIGYVRTMTGYVKVITGYVRAMTGYVRAMTGYVRAMAGYDWLCEGVSSNWSLTETGLHPLPAVATTSHQVMTPETREKAPVIRSKSLVTVRWSEVMHTCHKLPQFMNTICRRDSPRGIRVSLADIHNKIIMHECIIS